MSDALSDNLYNPSFREFNYTQATEVCINRVSFSKSCLYPTREHQKTKLVFFRLDSNIAARVIHCSVSSPHQYRGNSISTTRFKIQDNRMKIKGRIINHFLSSDFFRTLQSSLNMLWASYS